MPFDKLPGGNINTAPYANLRWPIYPPRPVFPTYEVTMNALNSILPALDPVERAKRQEALMNAKLAAEEMPVREQNINLEKSMLGIKQGLIGNLQKTGGAIDYNNPRPQVYLDPNGNIVDESRNPAAYQKRMEISGRLPKYSPKSNYPDVSGNEGAEVVPSPSSNTDLSDSTEIEPDVVPGNRGR